MARVRFTIHYAVKEKRKFENFLNHYKKEIGFELKELTVDTYWKIKGHFRANFFVENNSQEKEVKVYEILTLANKLWPNGGWTIHGPHKNEFLIFECMLTITNDAQPLKWAHLELENE